MNTNKNRDVRGKLKGLLISLFLGLLFVAAAAYITWKETEGPRVIYIKDEQIRSIYETQRQMQEHGYDVQVDGIWGKKTEKSYCDWCAKQSFK